jgi:hypothetical protein
MLQAHSEVVVERQREEQGSLETGGMQTGDNWRNIE